MQTGKGQAASQDRPISDWHNADEWPLALLFPHEHLAQWSGAPAAFPAAMLHGLAVNDLVGDHDSPQLAPAESANRPDVRPMLFRGMQFVLRLRSPLQTEQRHADAHRLLLDQAIEGHGIQGLASLEIMAGPHIVAARNSAPVMAAMLELAGLLIDRVRATIIGWGPADQIMPAPYFVRTAAPFAHGGPWPILALVQMHQSKAGQWQTIGLDWLFGQNVMLEVPPDFDRLQALDRLVALARDIAEHGPISDQGCIPGKATGEQLTISLQPRSDGRRDVAARLLIG